MDEYHGSGMRREGGYGKMLERSNSSGGHGGSTDAQVREMSLSFKKALYRQLPG